MNSEKKYVTFSVESFKTKPRKEEYGKILFEKNKYSIDEIIEQIRHGHIFCANYADNDERFCFAKGFSKKEKFCYTHIVTIDFDSSEYNPEYIYNSVLLKPSYLHTTYSHTSTDKRFHAIYLFTDKIKSCEQYRLIYQTIIEGYAKDIEGFTLRDNCGYSPYQLMNSNFLNNSNFEEFYDKTAIKVYSISDFLGSIILSNSKQVSCPVKNNKNHPSTLLSLNGQFEKDYYELSPSCMIEKYREQYPYLTSTPVNFNEDGYAILDEDYTEIYRKWYRGTGYKDNGDTYNYSVPCKIRKGTRGKMLYKAALLFRKIIPDISTEHLVFCLLCERYYHYDNSDKELSNRRLLEIASAAMLSDVKINSKSKKRFMVDKAYCARNGVTPNQHKQKVKKELTDKTIGELYDCSLSVAKNLANLRKNGMKIGRSRLYEWVKEFNVLSLEKKVVLELDKSYYDYQSNIVFENLDKEIKNDEYDISSSFDLKCLFRRYVIELKKDIPDISKEYLIETFKKHYRYAS